MQGYLKALDFIMAEIFNIEIPFIDDPVDKMTSANFMRKSSPNVLVGDPYEKDSRFYGNAMVLMPKTVLVVDDEEIIIEISKRRLEERGYTVLIAGNGHEAFQVLKTKIPDLILLDVRMPEINGYTFIMEKVKIPEYVNIPVVILTAYNEMEPLFKRHAVKDYLLKPLKLQDVINKVIEIIGLP